MRRQNPSRICSRHGLALSASSGGMEESREKREERREQMAASSIHCIFTVPLDQREQTREGREQREERRGGWRGGAEKARPPKSRSIDGSNRCILRVDRDCVERIHRAYAVAMALPSPRPRAGWKKAGRREKREKRNWPPTRFTAYLESPVTRRNRGGREESRDKKEDGRQLESLHF